MHASARALLIAVGLEFTPLDHSGKLSMLLCLPMEILRLQDNNMNAQKNLIHFPICACHPWGHANLLCIVPILSDVPRRESTQTD